METDTCRRGVSRFGCLIVLAFGLLGVLPPNSARACSRTWLIFFDRGATALTARGEDIAQAFVSFTRHRRPWTEQELGNSCGPLTPGDWRFLVGAHAQDPEAADQCALSRARGAVVRDRLIALGLPEAEVVVVTFGDRRPMVLSPLEQAEPQNRRVELGYVTAEAFQRMRMHPEPCPG